MGGLAAIMFLLMIDPRLAQADSQDTFNLTAGYRVQTDTNLFRLPPSAVVPPTRSRSEQIDTTTVGASIDKEYSLQNFRINATAVDYRYRKNEYLSYTSVNYSAAWLWAVTPRIRGTLATDKGTSLNNFLDFRNVSFRNLRTTKSTRFSAEGEVIPAIRIFSGVQNARTTNELPVVQEGDESVDSAFIGARLVFPSGNYFSYRFRKGSGDYFNRVSTPGSGLPTSLDEDEQELRMLWSITGKTSLVARLAHLERTHPGVPVRDFAGTVGNLGVDWAVTGKTRVAANFGRDLNSYQTNTSSYVTADRFVLAPTWALGAHTTLKANYQYAMLNYRGALPGQAPVSEREDNERTVGLGLDWRPRETISVTFAIQNTRRTSNTAGLDYRFSTAAVGAQIKF